MTRMWRSRPVTGLALAIALTLVGAACTSSDGGDQTDGSSTTAATATTATTTAPETTVTTKAKPQKPYGGEVIVADDEEPPTLNPFLPGGHKVIVSIIGQGYLAGVQEVDGYSLDLVPELVTELPTTANEGVTLNDDGTMTVRYVIRDEAVWEDGTAISGADFLFTLETILDPDLPIDKATYEDIDLGSIVVGEKSFEYTLAAPTALFELIFPVILPKHSIEGSDFATEWTEKMWASSGPFVFSEWAKGEFIKLVRNDNYWKIDPKTDQQLPYLDSVVFRFMPENDSIISAFKAREVDIIQPDPNTDTIGTIETLRALESEGARVEILSGPDWEHLTFQFGDGRFDRNGNSCNESLAMRQAVGHAIDKQLLVDEILGGRIEPLDSYVTAFIPALSQDSWAQYTFDSVVASDLYAKAVEETGKECSVVFTTTKDIDARVQLSELLAGMFLAAGIPYEIDLEDPLVFFSETFDTARWDLGEWAWIGSAPGMSSLVAMHDSWDPEALPPPHGSNLSHWGMEAEGAIPDTASIRYAEVRDEMNATVDPTELADLIHEAEKLLADNAVMHPLYARLVTAAVWKDEVGGFKHNPTSASYTWNIEDWYRADG